jgi:Protein of unknown function (DUF4232)
MTPSAHAARQALAAAALVCSAALVAACGSAQSTSNGQVTSESSKAPLAPAVSPGISAPASSAMPTPTPVANACSTADLKVTVLTSSGGAAAGSIYYPLNFTNVSSSSCVLDGYPGTSFVTSPSGSPIGSPASRNPAVAPAPVTLAPGATAHSTLQVVDAQNYDATTCAPVTAHWLRVFPPGETVAAEISFTTMVCSAQMSSSLGSPLTVDAIKAGEGQPGKGL